MNKNNKRVLSTQRKQKIGPEASLYFRIQHQDYGVSCYALAKRHTNYAERSVYRHAKKPLDSFDKHNKQHDNKGRPRSLTVRDERNVFKALHNLRKESAAFTSQKIQNAAGLTAKTCNRTVRRVLRKKGYGYRQTRKKGLLTENDKTLRLNFARLNVKKDKEFWNKSINFYFDGVGFAH